MTPVFLTFLYVTGLSSAAVSAFSGKRKESVLYELPFLCVCLYLTCYCLHDHSSSLWRRWMYVSAESNALLFVYLFRSTIRIPLEFLYDQTPKMKWNMVLHHSVASLGFLFAYMKGMLHFYVFAQLLNQSSSIFLNLYLYSSKRLAKESLSKRFEVGEGIESVLEKGGLFRVLYLLNGVLLVSCFFLFRVVMLPTLFFRYFSDILLSFIFNMEFSLYNLTGFEMFMVLIFLPVINSSLIYLNWIWFQKIYIKFQSEFLPILSVSILHS